MTGTSGSTIPAGFLVATKWGAAVHGCGCHHSVGSTGTGLALIRAVETGREYNTAAGTVRVIVNTFLGKTGLNQSQTRLRYPVDV